MPWPLRPALHNVRSAAAIARARPAYAAGVRAAIATVAPLVVAHVAGLGGGTWMSIAGLNGALVDRGGPYRTRAETIAALTLASAATVLLGALVPGRLAVAVPATFVVATTCSLGRAWGTTGANVGIMTLLAFAVSLTVPAAGVRDAVGRAAYVLAGGAWVLLLMVVVWPIHPHRPIRRAVAACWRALARHADEVAAHAVPGTRVGPSDAAWTRPPESAAMRTALEEARTVLATTRRGRGAETGRGERLLVLHEITDQIFAHLIAVGEAVEAIPPEERDPAAQTVLAETLATAAETARALATQIETERETPAVPVPWSGETLRAPLPDAGDADGRAPAAVVHYAQAAVLLDRVAEYARAASAIAAAMSAGRPAAPLEPAPTLEQPEPPPPALMMLRAVLSPDSVVLRHALRVGLVTAFAVWLTTRLGLGHGYWVTLTAVVILQPYTGATTQRAMQRVAGTVLGAILTAGLSALFHDERAILALAFVFSAACVALLPLSYAMFSTFLTPAFVLLAEASVGDWHLAGVRVLNTLLGGALAVVGALVLWPSAEWRRLPAHGASALRANAAYLRAAAALLAAPRGTRDDGRVRAARRAVGLAALNAEESFQRLLGEHRGPPEALEPVMAFLTYTRRVAAAVSALVLARHAADAPPAEALEPFAHGAARLLDDLADAVAGHRPPAPFPDLPEAALTPVFRARVERLTRLLRTMHDAVGRWIEHGERATAGSRA